MKTPRKSTFNAIPRRTGRTPIPEVAIPAPPKRTAREDAAALDATLAAGKRLRPPPTRFDSRAVSAGAVALRREEHAGTIPKVRGPRERKR